MATFLLTTIANIKANIILKHIFEKLVTNLKISIFAAKTFLLLKYVLCIYHPIQFKKDQIETWALIHSNSKINAIILAYAKKIDFQTQKTIVRA